jgi:hypothetical protein
VLSLIAGLSCDPRQRYKDTKIEIDYMNAQIQELRILLSPTVLANEAGVLHTSSAKKRTVTALPSKFSSSRLGCVPASLRVASTSSPTPTFHRTSSSMRRLALSHFPTR